MFLLAINIVRLMAKAFKNKLTFTHYIIQYGRHGFLKLVNANSMLAKKTLFLCFFIKKKIKKYAIECQTTMTNNIHHLRAELKTFIFHMSCVPCHLSLKGLLSTDFTSFINLSFYFLN